MLKIVLNIVLCLLVVLKCAQSSPISNNNNQNNEDSKNFNAEASSDRRPLEIDSSLVLNSNKGGYRALPETLRRKLQLINFYFNHLNSENSDAERENGNVLLDDDEDDNDDLDEDEQQLSRVNYLVKKSSAPRRIFIGKRVFFEDDNDNADDDDDADSYDESAIVDKKNARRHLYLGKRRLQAGDKRSNQIHRIFIGKRGDIKRIFIG